ncbi:hypothetical protein EIN_209950 [Entamoeba invadens IP1]|uniref:Uncharacterized protein n=1 Tax=Entamoeba invadens IP1 TaxID=370355 RepID=L7FNM6_ENTIV|nr:hypothetical protein EIN_209950 [Entamoeba invadens IP1]ELP94516.1 hypothetical protein EIN_209950 [Entamoeba invadens IP1]|eukprot:XP_004261287.1 hypothetical protein EIN_209950 [Entamoeba invadens IP1]
MNKTFYYTQHSQITNKIKTENVIDKNIRTKLLATKTYYSYKENKTFESKTKFVEPSIITNDLKHYKENIKNIKYNRPVNTDSLINTTRFNYQENCGKVFQYKPNNKRDLWLTAVGFKDVNYFKLIQDETIVSFGLAQSSIPNADKVVLLLPGVEIPGFDALATKYGIKVLKMDFSIFSEFSNKKMNLRSYKKEDKENGRNDRFCKIFL